MGLALALSALLMGLAGSWHCAVMCGATSGGVQRACSGGAGETRAWWGFQLGRLLGYATAGAVVASSVAVLAQLGQWGPALRPVWALAHSAALGLGLWLLWTGRQPGWLARLGRGGVGSVALVSAPMAWQPMRGPWSGALRATAAGAAWFAWPCGLLQSALMLAALANGPADGALVMAAFALGSSVGLGALPIWRLARLRTRKPGLAAVDHTPTLMRAAGAALAAGSAWALGHGLWASIQAYCL